MCRSPVCAASSRTIRSSPATCKRCAARGICLHPIDGFGFCIFEKRRCEGMRMGTALITHADCLDHVTPNGHPERVARLEHVLHALQELDLVRETAPEVDEAHLAYVHPQSHIDAIKAAIPSEGRHQIDADTWASSGS